MANWIENYTKLEAVTAEGETVIILAEDVAEDAMYTDGHAIITGAELLSQRENELLLSE
jgi:hypothetical protein